MHLLNICIVASYVYQGYVLRTIEAIFYLLTIQINLTFKHIRIDYMRFPPMEGNINEIKVKWFKVIFELGIHLLHHQEKCNCTKIVCIFVLIGLIKP